MIVAGRFYKNASVVAESGGFRILLDGRPVRTPAKAVLELPTLAAAEAIAAEWQAQGDKINPASMPLTRMANTAIDRMPEHRDATIDEILAYAGSDLLCYRAEAPDSLAARQAAAFDPLLDWLDHAYGVRLKVTYNITHVTQDTESLARLRKVIAGCDNFTLVALSSITNLAGSAVIGLAVLQGRLSGLEARNVSNTDELFQAEFWGEDAEAQQRLRNRGDEMAQAVAFIALFDKKRDGCSAQNP